MGDTGEKSYTLFLEYIFDYTVRFIKFFTYIQIWSADKIDFDKLKVFLSITWISTRTDRDSYQRVLAFNNVQQNNHLLANN